MMKIDIHYLSANATGAEAQNVNTKEIITIRGMQFRRWAQALLRNHRGSMLLESVIAVGILGTVLSTSIHVLATGSRAIGTVQALTTAQGIARSQFEYTKSNSYCAPPCNYATIDVPVPYTVTAEAQIYSETDTNLEYVVVTVYKNGKSLTQIKEIRVNR